MAQFRRRILLIDPKFQLKFSFFVASWVGALSILYPMILHNVFKWFTRYILLSDPTVPIEKIEAFRTTILHSIILLQVFFVALVFLMALYLSHRVSGPIFKLKRALAHLALGQFEKITFRKSDHFKEAAEEYNRAVLSIEQSIKSIETELEKAKASTTPDATRSHLERALSEVKKFKEISPGA